jgi:hypothetical protein
LETIMKYFHLLTGILAVGIVTSRVDAQTTLYGTTGSNATGQLVTLDPATGAVLTTVGPTNIGANNVGITGLAYNPVNGLLYGSTGNGSNYPAATRAHLVTVNTATGAVTDIGAFNASPNTMVDIAFNSSGQLFGIGSNADAVLFSINTTTGAATGITTPGTVPGTVGGGLAFHPTTGVLYASPLPTNFGTYNPTTGAYTNIGTPAPLPAGTTSSFAAMKFNPAGVLYAANLDTPQTGSSTTPKVSHLVTINLMTAAVTDLGQSINNLDAIAFVPVPEPASVLAAGAAGLGFVLRRSRRSRLHLTPPVIA